MNRLRIDGLAGCRHRSDRHGDRKLLAKGGNVRIDLIFLHGYCTRIIRVARPVYSFLLVFRFTEPHEHQLSIHQPIVLQPQSLPDLHFTVLNG
jgi:hypothetical protein